MTWQCFTFEDWAAEDGENLSDRDYRAAVRDKIYAREVQAAARMQNYDRECQEAEALNALLARHRPKALDSPQKLATRTKVATRLTTAAPPAGAPLKPAFVKLRTRKELVQAAAELPAKSIRIVAEHAEQQKAAASTAAQGPGYRLEDIQPLSQADIAFARDMGFVD